MLDKLPVENSNLLVKVDEKTQRYLQEYHAKTQAMLKAARSQTHPLTEDGELVDEEQGNEDGRAKVTATSPQKKRKLAETRNVSKK